MIKTFRCLRSRCLSFGTEYLASWYIRARVLETESFAVVRGKVFGKGKIGRSRYLLQRLQGQLKDGSMAQEFGEFPLTVSFPTTEEICAELNFRRAPRLAISDDGGGHHQTVSAVWMVCSCQLPQNVRSPRRTLHWTGCKGQTVSSIAHHHGPQLISTLVQPTLLQRWIGAVCFKPTRSALSIGSVRRCC